MAFNTAEIRAMFNAGIATVAVNSPTAAEQAITQKLATDLAVSREMDVLLWDAGKNLQKVVTTYKGKTITGISKLPVIDFKIEGHPVASVLKYIEAECKPTTPSSTPRPVLFIIKDLYPYIAGRDANPALVRLAIDACGALKRSPNRMIILHDDLTTPKVFTDLISDAKNPLPSETEAEEILKYRIEALRQSAKVQKREFPVTLTPNDKKRLVRALLGMTQEGMDDAIQLAATKLGCLDDRAVDAISQRKRDQFAARGIEYAKAPDVEVKGLPLLSEWATDQAALLEPEAQELYNIPFPKGTLLVGVGGTGKTLSVKCISKLWGLPVVLLDTSKLMTKELGGSEANLRAAIEAAQAMAPSILFVDEFDKMFPGSGVGETDGGTSSRMFGYFLQWFQESDSQVFVAATANRPWAIKPETLRRFTQTFYVDLPSPDARQEIFQVQLERYKLHIPPEDIQTLAAKSDSFTGDEIRKVVQECAARAYAQRRPGTVSTQELLEQITKKPPQFKGDTEELELLRKWARSGQAVFASPDPIQMAEIDPSESDRHVFWTDKDVQINSTK